MIFTMVTAVTWEDGLFIKNIELACVPPVDSFIRLDDQIFIVRSITFWEDGQIFIVVEARGLTDKSENVPGFVLPGPSVN